MRSQRQSMVGRVVSNKMDKTVVVQIETLKQHPQYKKFIRSRKRYKAHDEKNECGLGDKVQIMECRPMSAEKKWRVAGILEKGVVPSGDIFEPEELFKRRKKDRSKAAAEPEIDEEVEIEEEEAEVEEDAPEATEPASETAAEAPAEPAAEEASPAEADAPKGQE